MIAVLLNQKCRVAKTKWVGHSAFKFGREGKCVRLIGIYLQDTGDARNPVNAVGSPPAVPMTGTDFSFWLVINVLHKEDSKTKATAFRCGITAIGMMPALPTSKNHEGAGAGA